MTSLIAVIVLGFFLGMRHAIEPDHVVAVTTLLGRKHSHSGPAGIGAAWGLGHTLTLLLVGGGIILFGWVIPPRIGLAMEFSVGLMLILLGLMNLTGVIRLSGTGRLARATKHRHTHASRHGNYVPSRFEAHDSETHLHEHERTPLSWLARRSGWLHFGLARPLVIGIVHGLAGSAAVALLVLTTISNPRWGLLYLLVFGLGTTGGMVLMTAIIALPFTRTHFMFAGVGGGLRIASAVISLGFGVFVAYRTGFVGGLFTENVQWTPR
jgi:ABC-type nickel/cobalt efflux system permease component RcnA